MGDFHQTRMGQQFFEGTMPRLVKAVEKLAEQVEMQNQAGTVLPKSGWEYKASPETQASHKRRSEISPDERHVMMSVSSIQSQIMDSYVRMATNGGDANYIEQQEAFCRARLQELKKLHDEYPEIFIEKVVMNPSY